MTSKADFTRALDPVLYRSADTFERERTNIFRKSWRLAGHENMIAKTGDFLSDDIAGAGFIVVRAEDGTLKAFHNVCRHRAGPLTHVPIGNCGKELTCKYHGWRYTLDGRLRSARDFGKVDGFDPRDFALYAVQLATWNGLIFVSIDEDAPEIDELMAPVADAIPETMQPFALRRSHEIACNWKVYVENYLEGYHVPDVHPGLNAEVDASAYRVDMHDRVAVHTAPSKKDDAVYTGYWAWVWPWLGVNIYSHGLMMERISPLAQDRTRLDYLYFFDPDRRDELDAMIALSDEVTREDKDICEAVQRNLNARIYEAGLLSPKHEGAVAWFQSQIKERI